MNRRRPAQAVRKDRGLVETTVSVRILEPFDLAMMFLVALREVPHLGDKKPSVLVERQRDRLSDQRFSRDEFEAKAIFELKSLQGIRCATGGNLGSSFGSATGPGAASGVNEQQSDTTASAVAFGDVRSGNEARSISMLSIFFMSRSPSRNVYPLTRRSEFRL